MAIIDNWSDDEFIQLVESSNNLRELAEKVGYTAKSGHGRTICSKRCKKLGISLPTGIKHIKKSRLYDISDEDFIKIIKNSQSLTDACKRLGFSIYGSNGREQIKKRCELLGISIPKYNVKTNPNFGNKKDLKEILVENSTYKSAHSLKKRLVKEGLLLNQCYICGNQGEWQGKELSLQLHHINGIHNDNRIENLQILCPNCHSQTESFSGKNKPKLQDNDELS